MKQKTSDYSAIMQRKQKLRSSITAAKSKSKLKVKRFKKNVENFKYLGAWTERTEKDVNVRKALAWSACHKLRKIWSSNLKRQIKIRLFVSTVESVLLYGSETWTLTNTITKQIDGVYTRMLRMVKNISWRDLNKQRTVRYANCMETSQKYL